MLITMELLLLVATVPLLSYALVCGAVANRWTRARRRLPVVPPTHPDLARDQVEFMARDGKARLAAWYFPAMPRRGAVIFVHGKDGCRGDELKSPTLELAQHLQAHGLSVLMIDLRGHGRSSRSRLSYGVHETEDVLGAVDYLIARGYQPGRIGVLGASMGGVAALKAAVREPALGAVVADSPYADFAMLLQRHFGRLTHMPDFVRPGVVLAARLLTRVDLPKLHLVLELEALRRRPVLVVHGEHDPLVPASEGKAIADACAARLWLTSSGTHLGSFREQPQIYAAIMQRFFLRHLVDEIIDGASTLASPLATSAPYDALAGGQGA